MVLGIKKNILLFIIGLVFIANVVSQNTPFDMISTGDPILNDLRYLGLVTGRSFLSFTPPLAPAEVRNFVDGIDRSLLPASAQEAYDRILNRLVPSANFSFSSGVFSTFIEANSTLTARLRFNRDVSEFPQNPNIDPIIAIPTRFNFGSNFQLFIEPSVTMRPSVYQLDRFDINIPQDYWDFNETQPLRFYAAAGGEWWNFQIGRDRLFWGTGHTGSLTFSDNSQYFDFARFSVFSPVLKYSLIVNQMPLNLSRSLFYPDNDTISSWWDNPANRTRSIHRYYYLQRLDIKLFNRLSIGIMEGIMVGNSPLQLRYLNPLRVFHSLFSWEDYDLWMPPPSHEGWIPGNMVGNLFSLELNWNIMRNLSVYGQFVLNEFATRGELRGDPNQPPNAMGYLAGFQFSRSFNTWSSIFFIEFVYTDPFLSILGSPFASFIQQNRFGQFYYFGYQRDTVALTLGANLFNSDFLTFSGNLSLISSGSNNRYGLIWNWERTPEAFDQTTPTATSENKLVLALESGWRPLNWLTLNFGITGIISMNNNHVQGDNAVGGQASFSVRIQY